MARAAASSADHASASRPGAPRSASTSDAEVRAPADSGGGGSSSTGCVARSSGAPGCSVTSGRGVQVRIGSWEGGGVSAAWGTAGGSGGGAGSGALDADPAAGRDFAGFATGGPGRAAAAVGAGGGRDAADDEGAFLDGRDRDGARSGLTGRGPGRSRRHLEAVPRPACVAPHHAGRGRSPGPACSPSLSSSPRPQPRVSRNAAGSRAWSAPGLRLPPTSSEGNRGALRASQ